MKSNIIHSLVDKNFDLNKRFSVFDIGLPAGEPDKHFKIVREGYQISEAVDYIVEYLESNVNYSKRHRLCTFENYDKTDNLESFNKVLEYANFTDKRHIPSLIMRGNNGTGKTHLIYALATYWIYKSEYYSLKVANDANFAKITYRGPKYKIIRENDLFLRIRQTFKKGEYDNETESDIYNELASYDVLAIDDVLKYTPSDLNFYQRVMFQIIDSRYNNIQPLIISTNKSMEEMGYSLGPASADRINEMSLGYQLEFKGTSHRTSSNNIIPDSMTLEYMETRQVNKKRDPLWDPQPKHVTGRTREFTEEEYLRSLDDNTGMRVNE